MIRRPDFRKVLLVIPVRDVILGSGGFERMTEALSRQVRKFRGRLSAGRSQTIAQLRDALEKAVEKPLCLELSRLSRQVNENTAEWMLISVDVTCDFSSGDLSIGIKVTIDFHTIFLLYANFLETVQEERPDVYPLFRHIIEMLSGRMPVRTIEGHYEYLTEGIDPEEMEEGFLQAIDDEMAAYRKHIREANSGRKVTLRDLRKLYWKVLWNLSDEENLLVQDALRFLAEYDKNPFRGITFCEPSYYDERLDEASFFNLLWDPSGAISSEVENDFNNYGNYNAPGFSVVVKNRKDLEKLKRLVRVYFLYCKILWRGYMTWNQGK